MVRYETLEHPSELRIRIYGRDKQSLFRNANNAMQKFMQPQKLSYKGKHTIKLVIESMNLDSLLVDFLSEILTACHVGKAVYPKIYFNEFRDDFIDALLLGYEISGFEEDIKAVTYQDLHITKIVEKGKKIYTTDVVFDI